MATARVLYFASLREAAGCEGERVSTDADTLAQLYRELSDRHGFALPREAMRVAVDGEFADWSEAVREGSEVVFLPPVSGG